MAFSIQPVPPQVKKQQALDYALFEMATSYFHKASFQKSVIYERMWLAWCEIARQKQYDAEDEILKLLDDSQIADELFEADKKDAKVTVIRSKDGTHNAFRFVGDDFEFIVEVNPTKENPKRYELSFNNIKNPIKNIEVEDDEI